MPLAEDFLGLAARVALHQAMAPSRAAIKRRIIGVVVCGVLAAIAGLGALAWASAAFWLWLSVRISPVEAALAVMGALLLALLILALIIRRLARPRRAAALPNLANLVSGKALTDALESHLPQLVIAAAIGGLLLGLRRRK